MTYPIPLGRYSAQGCVPLGFGAKAHCALSGALIMDSGDAGLVTIAGTGTGKGVSQVIPTALTYPGSMVIMDIKGEIAAVTARARREMGQQVIILDPFGGSQHALNPMEAINPASPDAYDQCKRIAAMLRNGAPADDPFWEDVSEMIIAGTILFLATHIPRANRALPLLHRMWGVADHLAEMLTAMQSCHLHGGAMAAAARAYTDAPDKTRSSILTTLRNQVGFMASQSAERGLSGGWGLLGKVREAQPMTIYLRVPPHMLAAHGKLLRLWIGTILTTVAERTVRPAIPDLFLVDEAATLGRLDELLTAASLLRGYGLRTWTFWQSIGQMEGIYGVRTSEILDNAGTLSMFGAPNAASARAIEALTGYAGPILGMPSDAQILCRQGAEPLRAQKLDYRTDSVYGGLFDPNPFHAQSRTIHNSMEVAA